MQSQQVADTASPPPGPTVTVVPVPSMNVWSFLHHQCLRLSPRTVALLILAGLLGLVLVIATAGKGALAAAALAAVRGLVRRMLGKGGEGVGAG